MKKFNKIWIAKICAAAGGCLLLAGALLLIFWQWRIHSATEKSQVYLQTLQELIPAPQGASVEERSDNAMAAISVEGNDFIGWLEMPRYGSVLPIGADWGQVSQYPCRLSGSVYDRSLQIGATSQKGQYDFYRELSVGDAVFFVDAEGNRYSYTIQSLRYAKHADQTTLTREDAAFTLFIKNIYDFEYLIVSCK